MNALTEIRKARGLTQRQLAERLNTTDVSISRYEKEDQRLTLPLLRRLARELGCTVAALASEADIRAEGSTQLIFVNTYDVEASAGDGTVVDEDHITGSLAFQPDWLRSVTQAGPPDLGVIQVRGDSMNPTLVEGDHVLVDFTQVTPRADGIFVIRYDDAVQVKRVALHPVSMLVTVRSDNPVYPEWPDLPTSALDIVGRVIWLGRRV